MSKPNNQKARHHYVPVVILDNFTDINRHLWYWNREKPIGEVVPVAPENAFLKKHFYTRIGPNGERNVELEYFFGELESTAGDFLRKPCARVRSGNTPRLSRTHGNLCTTFGTTR